jgi:hypothetical protein
VAGRRGKNPDVVRARVERYRDVQNLPSASADLGRRLWRGEEITSGDGVALGASTSIVFVLIADFELAGYRVTRRKLGRNSVSYKLEGGAGAVPRQVRARRPRPSTNGAALDHAEPLERLAATAVRQFGLPYPALGSVLEVRALALIEGDGLVMHLRDGSTVWQARVTGVVEGH